MLLAQYSPTFTAGELFAFLGIAVFVLFAVVLSRKVFGHEPPLHKEYFTKTEHAEFANAINTKLEKQDAHRSEIRTEQKAQGLQISALQAESTHQTKTLAEIKSEQQEVRRDIKEDNAAMNIRVGEVLVSLGEIKGRLKP